MWNTLRFDTDIGALSFFDRLMRKAHAADPSYIPDLSRSRTIFATSDFTGDQKESKFNCFTFVITTADAWQSWNHRRKDLRRRFRLAKRRISYSKLRDTRKSEVLFPFLFAANAIPGLAVTVLVDKRIQSLFVTEGKLRPSATEGIDFTSWRPHVYERMLRATHLLALFVAGTCSPGQNIIWITDEDEIAANVERLTQLTHAFGRVMGNLCPHNLGHLRVGTTGTTDSGELEIEDFAALPDLIGGAVNEVLSAHEREGARFLSGVIVPPPKNLPRKVHDLLDALLDDAAVLRKLVVAIGPIEDSTAIRFTEINFHSQRRLVT